MIVLIVISILIFILTREYKTKNIQAHVPGTQYETTHFGQSGGRSLEIFDHMKHQGVSHETLLKFVTMEDQFLAYEKQSVCNGRRDVKILAISLDKEIKETFPGYDFSYHVTNLKQIYEPEKMVNRHLKCF